MRAMLDTIVTRDPTGYANATLSILTPADFLRRLRAPTH